MTHATRSSSCSRVAPAAASAAPEPNRTNDTPGPAGALRLTHAATRDLFQLLYLLAWTRNLYSADHRDPTKQEEEVRRYARAILGRATHAAAVVAPWA